MTATMQMDSTSVLTAIYLSSLSRVEDLRKLFETKSWKPSLASTEALAILLEYLPATSDPNEFLPLVFDICHDRLRWSQDRDEEKKAQNAPQIEELEFLNRVSDNVVDRLMDRDKHLQTDEIKRAGPEQLKEWWIFRWICKLDNTVEMPDMVQSVLNVDAILAEMPDSVVIWREQVFEPILKLAAYYPSSRLLTGLKFHQLATEDIDRLLVKFLHYSTAMTITRDVKTVISPFLCYRDSIASEGAESYWLNFYKWMILKSESDFKWAFEFIRTWSGPETGKNVQMLYISAIIAICYHCADVQSSVFENMHALQKRALYLRSFADNSDMDVVSTDGIDDDMVLIGEDRAFAFPSSPLLYPSALQIKLLESLITSASMLSVYMPVSIATVALLRFYASHEEQLQFLLKLVRGKSKEYAYRDDSNWRTLRSASRWLRNKSLVLGKLSDSDVENIFLETLLEFGRINLVREIYIDPIQGPLDNSDVELHVLKSFQKHYDNASNCNATRGSLRIASQILHLVYDSISTSNELKKADLLLKATHELSKYSLTLSQGVPLSPLQIKINNNPEDIISQLLQSNGKSYLQIDELISITSNLLIGLGKPDTDRKGIEYRITRMCIYSALAADDFSTAYDYCMNRLWSNQEEIRALDNDMIWQVFFAAGRYVSPNALSLASSPSPQLTMLQRAQLMEKANDLKLQMQLLSRSMDICPENHIFEILNVWQDFELQLTQYMTK
ncbi:Sec39 domain-containing protein [Dipodascopsis uninucleata]